MTSREYVAPRAPRPPDLDGQLRGPWEVAPWTEAFMDIQGPDKAAPRHATRVKMMWDDSALYIGAWLDEPQPWSSLTLHDAVIYQDNDFEVGAAWPPA
ncbi:hypothetical protein V8C86DRAFT_3108242 [Haematococcus lacustris]